MNFSPLGVNCWYGVIPCPGVLYTPLSVGKVVGWCQLSHFEFLKTVVVHPAGIIRGTVWSKVETKFLLPMLRFFFSDKSYMLWPGSHSTSDVHNTFPISLSFSIYKVSSYLGAFTFISICISVRPILNLFLTISTCLRWEDVKGSVAYPSWGFGGGSWLPVASLLLPY